MRKSKKRAAIMPKLDLDGLMERCAKRHETLREGMRRHMVRLLSDPSLPRKTQDTSVRKKRSHATMNKPPLTAVLKTKDLEILQECKIPLKAFPDMIELDNRHSDGPYATLRQFFRIGITDRKAFYREGTSYRISQ
jgi:hypothetical protein